MTRPTVATIDRWTPGEDRILGRLRTPEAIQSFLDSIEYSSDHFYREPRRVLADRHAHCFDGAMLAAAALRRIGHLPLLVDLRAYRDDDHVIAVFRRGRHWGAVAKSNFVGLRYREPIHRNLRELALTYFESYYNMEGVKSLRSFSVPVDLGAFDRDGWMFRPDCIDAIVEKLDAARHYPVLSRSMVRGLSPVDRRTFKAGMIGSIRAGIYFPPKEH